MAETLADALALHRAGRLQEAEAACRAIVAREPRNADALHLQGGLCLARAAPDEAARLIRAALEIEPDNAVFHCNLGTALMEAGDRAGAIDHFGRALEIEPDYVDAHYNLGNALLAAGRHAEAIGHFRRAVALEPRHLQARNNLAFAQREAGRAADAIATLEEALARHPDDRATRANLALLLREAGRTGDADSIEANTVDGLLRLAEARHRKDDFAGVEMLLRRALDAVGDQPQILNNLAVALKRQGRVADSIEIYRRSLALEPDNPDVLGNLGSAAFALGEVDAAETALRRALEIAPDNGQTLKNLGILLVSTGRLREGWRTYLRHMEQEIPRYPGLRTKAPLWQGEPLGDGRLMLWGHQGVGDELLYASMIPDLIARGIRCLYRTDARLVPLFRRSFPEIETIAYRTGDDADEGSWGGDIAAHCPVSLLGLFFRNGFDDFPDRTGHLKPDPARTAALRARYREDGRPVIGISWRSSAAYSADIKSSDLVDWGPVLEGLDATFVSLQYGAFGADVARARTLFGARIVEDAEIDQLADLDGFAAQTAAMDLVVSTSSTTVHMAGALGVPVWTLLPKTGLALPYWFVGRDDCPWHRSMRLFRQDRQGDWAGLLERIGGELRRAFPDEGSDARQPPKPR